MITTPLITKLKTNGGTLYTFTSTSKDLTKVATNSSEYRFSFSHFACLNLPYIMSGAPTESDFTDSVSNITQTVDGETYPFFRHILFRIDYQDQVYVDVELEKSRDAEYVNEMTVVFQDKTVMMKRKNVSSSRVLFSGLTDGVVTGNDIKFRIHVRMNDDYKGNVKDIQTREIVYKVNYVGNRSEKGLYLEQFEGYEYRNNDYNVAIAEHFQNYILNFESVILNSDVYNPDILISPAERIFFNWLRKVGGIRFTTKSGKTVENVDSYYDDPDRILDRTVQYLGNIDILNQVDIHGDTFGEVYLYIPSGVGATPNVYFRSVYDRDDVTSGRKIRTNYKNDIYKCTSEKIVGRENYNIEERPVDDISLDAIYDGDVGSNYYLGDEGYCIDFRPGEYGVDSIDRLNEESYHNFEFNTVLIYYDMTHIAPDGTKTTATNLYGVLFLDNFVRDDRSTSDARLAYIDPVPKFRGSELDDGNSFALKVDLKIDTAPTTTMYRTTSDGSESGDMYYDPNDVRGFQLYAAALEQLHKCIDIFYDQQREIYELQDRVEKLESIIVNMKDTNELSKDIEMLKFSMNKGNDTDVMFSILNDNTRRLNRFIETNTTRQGVPAVNIGNDVKYSYVGKVSLDDTVDGDYIRMKDNTVILNLREGTNLVLLGENENGKSDMSKSETLTFLINTGNVMWKTGQSVMFVVCDDFGFEDIRHKDVVIRTRLDDTIVADIVTYSHDDILGMKDVKEIEIICLDDDFSTSGEKFIAILR